MDFNNKIPKTDYNLVNQRDIEMIDFRSTSLNGHEQPAASQIKRGKCVEEWDCCCFSCDCDCFG